MGLWLPFRGQWGFNASSRPMDGEVAVVLLVRPAVYAGELGVGGETS